MLLDLAAEHAGLVQNLALWTIAGLTAVHLNRKATR